VISKDESCQAQGHGEVPSRRGGSGRSLRPVHGPHDATVVFLFAEQPRLLQIRPCS
jgi:hypothetical protein